MTNIQEQMKELFGNSCLCYSYAFLELKSKDIKLLTRAVLNGWIEGYIEDDGFVKFPLDYLRNTLGLKVKDVSKVKISSLNDLPDNDYYVVEYVYGNGSHFVVAKNKKVVFDPAGDSNTVKKGKVYSYRKLKY